MANLAPKEIKTYPLVDPQGQPLEVKSLRLTNLINGSITFIAAVEEGGLSIVIEAIQLAPGGVTPSQPAKRFVLEG